MRLLLYQRGCKKIKMDEFAVFKFGNMEKDLEEKHPHKVVAIHKGKVILIGNTYDGVLKKLHEPGIKIKKSFIHGLGPSEDAIAILFGEIDVHLLGKSDRVVLDLEVVEV